MSAAQPTLLYVVGQYGLSEDKRMQDVDDFMAELLRFTPTQWAVVDQRGRTLVVLEATTAEVARRRFQMLEDELPAMPAHFTVRKHKGPVRCRWFGDGWFAVREELTRIDREYAASQQGSACRDGGPP